jgi:hypothetical protein
MTVTNFQGEARAYLEKLIEACGAKFTRNMTTENTHLIAASYPAPFFRTDAPVGKQEKSVNMRMNGESRW